MAITQAMCTSFKVDLLDGEHDFGADTFYIALFTSAATLDASTTAYAQLTKLLARATRQAETH